MALHFAQKALATGIQAAPMMVRGMATAPTKKLWGGRFSKDTDESVLDWVDAIPVDSHLRDLDIWGSLSHVTALGTQGIIPATSAGRILGGLLDIERKFATGELVLGTHQDDVHMDIEAKLIEAIGMDDGGRMHTCRSRNDQVGLDSSLYCRKRLLEIRQHNHNAIEAFLDRAANHLEDVMVGYTHIQHAQPCSLAFWLSHYASALLRDAKRFENAYNCTDKSILGGGALTGTSFPIDRVLSSQLMGFQRIDEHAMDGTSNRDYFMESVCAVAIQQSTFSRLAEEFIMWSSHEFRTITLDDGFAMGSSMMPQKKNPGTLELLRGRTGRINGMVTAAMTLMKGTPSSGYNRDLHEDKEILVETFDLANRAASIIPSLVHSTTFNLERFAELPMLNFSTATELANFLVAKHNVPFRESHHVVGSLVGKLNSAGKNLSAIDDVMAHLASRGLQSVARADVVRVLDPKNVMTSYESRGGTGPKSVATMMEKMKADLAASKKILATDVERTETANAAIHAIAASASRDPQALTQQGLRDIVKNLHPLKNYVAPN